MRKETLEEAAERFANNFTEDENKFAIEDFIAGAKWQQERSYSEEEVKKILHDWSIYKVNCIVDEFIDILTWEEWFEQFKKK